MSRSARLRVAGPWCAGATGQRGRRCQEDTEELSAICHRALATRGDGFSITAAHPIALARTEAHDASDALALADARMLICEPLVHDRLAVNPASGARLRDRCVGCRRRHVRAARASRG